MSSFRIKCSFAQGVGYTTSLREAGIGPEASGLIKLNRLGGDYHPLWDDSKNSINYLNKKNTLEKMKKTGIFIVLEIHDLTNDTANFGYYGVILRNYYGDSFDIYFCQLYEDDMGHDYNAGDIVKVTMTQNDEEVLKNYNFDDYTIEEISLINKLEWIRMN